MPPPCDSSRLHIPLPLVVELALALSAGALSLPFLMAWRSVVLPAVCAWTFASEFRLPGWSLSESSSIFDVGMVISGAVMSEAVVDGLVCVGV